MAGEAEASPKIWDPGGPVLKAVREAYPILRDRHRFVRVGRVLTTDGEVVIPKITMDTGADSGNYIGRAIISRVPNVTEGKCDHNVRLGDGATKLRINSKVSLTLQLLRPNDRHTEPIILDFFVVESLGDEAIIGGPSLTSSCLPYFIELLESISGRGPDLAAELVVQMQKLFLDIDLELQRNLPSHAKIESLINKAKKLGKDFRNERDKSGANLFLTYGPNTFEPTYGEVLAPWSSPDLTSPEEDLSLIHI